MSEYEHSKEYLNSLLKRASFDHDGVIADTRSLVANSFNKKYGTNYSANDMRHFHSVIDWGLGVGLKLSEAQAENKRLWYTSESLFSAEPVPGAIEFLHELHTRDKDFIINSSRIPELYESTIEWYKKYAPFITLDQIRIGIPDIADGGMTKVYRILTENLLIHFEDVPEQAKDVAVYTNAHVFLLSNLSTPLLEYKNKITHIRGVSGNMPDFNQLNNLFFG